MRNLAVCLALLFAAGGVVAESYPLNLSLTPDIALHERTDRIEGLSLSIWGENPQSAFALGLVNGSIDASEGLSIGLANYGLQYSGVQWSAVNLTEMDFAGWQGGFVLGLVGSVVNYSGGRMEGFQIGLLNLARHLRGLQVGVVNLTDTAGPGVQIGIVNIIEANRSWFGDMPTSFAPVMLLVNWRF